MQINISILKNTQEGMVGDRDADYSEKIKGH